MSVLRGELHGIAEFAVLNGLSYAGAADVMLGGEDPAADVMLGGGDSAPRAQSRGAARFRTLREDAIVEGSSADPTTGYGAALAKRRAGATESPDTARPSRAAAFRDELNAMRMLPPPPVVQTSKVYTEPPDGYAIALKARKEREDKGR